MYEDQAYGHYKSEEAAITNGQTKTIDVRVASNIGTSPQTLNWANAVYVHTDQTIHVSFNDQTETFTIPKTTGVTPPFVIDYLKITKLTVSNTSGSTANVSFFFLGKSQTVSNA